MGVRLIVADDHQMMREGLVKLLRQLEGHEVLAEAQNGREVVQLVKEHSPDIVIMDITMPQLNGIDATRMITADYPGTKVIALSVHADRQFVAEMFKAGASGYLLKMGAFEELATAIQVVMDGKTYVSPSIAEGVIDDYKRLLPDEESSPTAVLSDREREVLQLLAEGKAAKEIGMILHVSSKTIDTHRRQVMQKLGLHSVAELTKYAIRQGLTPLGE